MAARNYEIEKRIMALVGEGLYPSKIANVLNVSTTLILKHLKRLEKEGRLESYGKCPKFYNLKDVAFKRCNVGFSLPMNGRFKLRGKTDGLKSQKKPLISDVIRLHDFKIKIPILQKGKMVLTSKKVEINNWVKEYYNLDLPTKATLEITTQSAIIHFHSTDIPRNMGFNRALVEFATRGMVAVVSYLGRHGYRLDLMNPRVISQHLAADTAEEIDKQVSEGTVFKINLNRPAATITGEMQAGAAAWVDRSKGALEIETNDIIYEQALLEMPMRLIRVERGYSEYDKRLNLYDMNIKKHLAVLGEMSDALKEMRNYYKEKRKR
ncbi:MAG: helix-turn-helix domain-containing protein [Candidatus Omnitrophica bacterium]|nr:helix-turn-helix domain-containing protein [Candidatus Omnitrophota bacterium]